VAGLAGVDPRTVEDRIRSAPAPRPPAPPAPVVPSTEPERLLLRLLVQDLGEVANTLERMGALAWIRSPCVSTTVGRLLAAWRDKREPTAMELLPGLNDPQVLHALSEVLASESSWIPEENLEKAIQECLVRLRIDWSERQRARLARELHGLQQGQGGPNAGLLTEIAQQMVDLDRERTTLQLHLQELL